MLGVDYDLFWRLTPKKLEPFITAHTERSKGDMDSMNFAAWLSGVYVAYAIGSSLGEKNAYPESPISLFPTEEEMEEAKQNESELFSALAAKFNKEYKEENR